MKSKTLFYYCFASFSPIIIIFAIITIRNFTTTTVVITIAGGFITITTIAIIADAKSLRIIGGFVVVVANLLPIIIIVNGYKTVTIIIKSIN